MTFDEHLKQLISLLQREGRITYFALKRRLNVEDDYLADLTAELIDAKRLAVDEDGKVLVWVGASLVSGSTFQVPRSTSEDEKPETRNQKLASSSQTLDSRRDAGERRQLTVAFID